jgi:hypothetical protein
VKIETGKTYVIKVTDNKTVDILHEYTKKEKFMKQLYPVVALIIKVLLLIISALVPPLLLITIPVIMVKK